MPSQFIAAAARSLQGAIPRPPHELPHGLVLPPEKVRELLECERIKHSPESFNAAVEERLLNQWTLQYHFDDLGYEVIYRETAQGPEVLAVGDTEVMQLKKTFPLEEHLQLKTWMP